MSSWMTKVTRVLAWSVVVMQTGFGAMEIFVPRLVFCLVLDAYRTSSTEPLWIETAKVARNMGLYNWFLAVGLLLSLTGRLGGAQVSRFFILCVAVAGAFGLVTVAFKAPFVAQLVLGLGSFLLLKWSGDDNQAVHR